MTGNNFYPELKTHSAKVWSPSKGEHLIYWDTIEKERAEEKPLPTRKKLPKHNRRKLKDEEREQMMRFYHMEMKRLGVDKALALESTYRRTQAELLSVHDMYPLKLPKGCKGFIVDEKYLLEFPPFVQKAWQFQFEKGFYLVFMNGLAWMIHKDKLRILEEDKKDDLFMDKKNED